jgi:hypothetical protein
MRNNLIARLKHRLSTAIDWRVRQEFESEKQVIDGIGHSLLEMTAEYADKMIAMSQLIEDLDRRVKELESKK